MTILMTEEMWINSVLSVARHTGSIQLQHHVYTVVNKYGLTLFETSIPAGEPADLVREDFIPYYKKLGRDRFIHEMQLKSRYSEKELHAHFKELVKTKPTTKDNSIQTSLDL